MAVRPRPRWLFAYSAPLLVRVLLGMQVLELGCGTGLVSVAALLGLASHARKLRKVYIGGTYFIYMVLTSRVDNSGGARPVLATDRAQLLATEIVRLAALCLLLVSQHESMKECGLGKAVCPLEWPGAAGSGRTVLQTRPFGFGTPHYAKCCEF